MNCTAVDLKAYFLNELNRREKESAETHIGACETCREELGLLECTQATLLALKDEEIPQRIAFVSDRVFEPRWWQRVWRSGPVMGLASAALLAAAILVHGFARPVPVITQASVDTTQIEQRVQAEMGKRLDAAVAKAVADSAERQSKEFAKVLQATESKYEFQRKADMLAMQETVRYYDKQFGRLMVASNQGAGQ
jgi:hypothetical protein